MSSPINGSDSGCDDKRLTVEGYAEMWLAGNTINAQGRGLNLNVDMGGGEGFCNWLRQPSGGVARSAAGLAVQGPTRMASGAAISARITGHTALKN